MLNGRRHFLAGAGALVLWLGARRSDAATAVKVTRMLNPAEPAAKAIAYIENAAKVDRKAFPSYRRGQSCATCSLMEFGTARARACSIVPDRLVWATGWCRVWKLRGT